MTIQWSCRAAPALTTAELYAALVLRARVFVVEQQCIYPDADGLDLAADVWHLFGWRDDQLHAYLRLLGAVREDVVIGRVIVAPEGRGSGLGHLLLAEALRVCAERWPGRPLFLSAQAHLQAYYGRYGFTPCSAVYDEDGIPHIDMRRLAD
ncbi:ElaA protein [Pseudomonas sp. SORGH_AS 211]|uniref:GNAT family N-acetyltransferase n=1 Tax=Pseudomonas sp. SORGH_AS_0211 TaxID=3041796 RepID=UPI00285C2280|nr:GNAT family N-acetyltransferase [Pseudomonas sp. SORGH_AS_0211]MDR6177367.1 ElaA protein [Pseudomonas sp. SORGH_AS_0211]